jgi:hypothetical protein
LKFLVVLEFIQEQSQSYLVFQSTISSPILCNIYIADQPTTPHTSIADFADDKVIYISDKNPLLASQHLQNHLNLLEN